MAGKNPYFKAPETKLPEKKYKITFKPNNVTIEVDPSKIPYGRTGLPGSILDIAMSNGVDIEHTCGGVVACSTCHVYVNKGLNTCNEAEDAELDQLDNAPAQTLQSRLSCQCVPDGTSDVEVEIPGWNRNAVKETPHE